MPLKTKIIRRKSQINLACFPFYITCYASIPKLLNTKIFQNDSSNAYFNWSISFSPTKKITQLTRTCIPKFLQKKVLHLYHKISANYILISPPSAAVVRWRLQVSIAQSYNLMHNIRNTPFHKINFCIISKRKMMPKRNIVRIYF